MIQPLSPACDSNNNFEILYGTGSTGPETVPYLVLYNLLGTGTGITGTRYGTVLEVVPGAGIELDLILQKTYLVFF